MRLLRRSGLANPAPNVRAHTRAHRGSPPVSNATSTSLGSLVSGHYRHLSSIDFCCESARRCRSRRRSQSERRARNEMEVPMTRRVLFLATVAAFLVASGTAQGRGGGGGSHGGGGHGGGGWHGGGGSHGGGWHGGGHGGGWHGSGWHGHGWHGHGWYGGAAFYWYPYWGWPYGWGYPY